MLDKTTSLDEAVAQVQSGMTVGIGGWGSRRKPMALVRALLRSPAEDLTIVTFGGPDVGLLVQAGKVRKLVYGFVSLDSIPLDPLFTAARERGELETEEFDEGMFVTGLRAAAARLSFLPTRAGLGSDVLPANPALRMVASPYNDEEYVAMKALPLDVSFVHMNRADRAGNAQYLGVDPYFDDLFAMAAKQTFVSAEEIVETDQLLNGASHHTLLLSRMFVSGVIHAPRGAHFTDCLPDYGRDEAFQTHYAASARDPEKWSEFEATFLGSDEAGYLAAVDQFHARSKESA
jgi:glutaconate CoA-transferase, subunit A